MNRSARKGHRPPVFTERSEGLVTIVLNRPKALNSLTLDMIRTIHGAFEAAEADPSIHLIVFRGEGDRGFCAGGDVKALARAAAEGRLGEVLAFFREEYALDLRIHRCSKPVAVVADGITMGGGLGLAAGADVVLATERTHMAMPETRIGFFPDVGATGWLFRKCPPGYPEYLALTGYDLIGCECVRVGLATHCVPSHRLPEVLAAFKAQAVHLPDGDGKAGAESLRTLLQAFDLGPSDPQPDRDAWVRTYFSGKTRVAGILEGLKECGIRNRLCDDVFHRLSERSPTALVATLKLLRHNQGRSLEEVFDADLRAAATLIRHPDYTEGVRARLIDKDDRPRWRPPSIEEVGTLEDLQL